MIRPYRLGETIKIMVELGANGDVEVREARVDLVCEENYLESYNVMVPDIKIGRPVGGFLGRLGAAPATRQLL